MAAELFDPLAAPFRRDGTNGEAVVLTHGFTGTPAHFIPLADHLHSDGFTVVAPLLAGHGTHLDDMASTDHNDWLDSVRVAARSVADHNRVHLVGISMGGLLSIHLAPEVGPASLTTINSPVRFHAATAYLAPVMHRFRPTVMWEEGPEPDLDLEMRPYWLTYPGFPTESFTELMRLAFTAPGIARTLGIPALVIQSKTDESVHPSSGEILARNLRCRLVWLEDSLHMALLDRERHVIHAEVVRRLRTA
ncbi:MAG: alpha/beta fold hydrolase [Acidimicrobiia bacterium]|nr:alpha/beta fold hydrolase [Acidimicrobiia bacterium]